LTLKTSLQLTQVPCWNRSGTTFRNLFRDILAQLGLAELGLRPYSLRRGGATYEMQSHGLMEKTLIRGRWKNSNIARIYICDGLAMLPSLRMSLTSKRLVAEMSSIFVNEHHAYGGKRGNKRKTSSLAWCDRLRNHPAMDVITLWDFWLLCHELLEAMWNAWARLCHESFGGHVKCMSQTLPWVIESQSWLKVSRCHVCDDMVARPTRMAEKSVCWSPIIRPFARYIYSYYGL